MEGAPKVSLAPDGTLTMGRRDAAMLAISLQAVVEAASGNTSPEAEDILQTFSLIAPIWLSMMGQPVELESELVGPLAGLLEDVG